jgi:hypothetical protein
MPSSFLPKPFKPRDYYDYPGFKITGLLVAPQRLEVDLTKKIGREFKFFSAFIA